MIWIVLSLLIGFAFGLLVAVFVLLDTKKKEVKERDTPKLGTLW